jgi:hypothetical protein
MLMKIKAVIEDQRTRTAEAGDNARAFSNPAALMRSSDSGEPGRRLLISDDQNRHLVEPLT